MAINQVQLRLSIDGQQALSALSSLEIKQQDLIASNKELSDSRTKEMDNLKNGLVEIYKLQEKQALLEKQMAAASEKGNPVLLTKLEGQYEANANKLNILFEAQVKYNDVIHESDLALAANNKIVREQRKELEALYLADGDVLRSEAALVKEKRALTRESSLASNGSERQAKAETRLAEVNKELTNRIRDRAKASIAATQTIIKEQGIEKVSTDDLITLNKALETANKHRTDRTTEDAKREIESIKEVNAELAKRKEETAPDKEGGLSGLLKDMKGGLPAAVAGATAGMFVGMAGELTGMLTSAVGSAFEAIKKQARDVTDIEVALNTSRESAQKIKGELNDIRTETSVEQLKKLVEVAGDLNVAEQDVKAFVAQADQFGVVMGKDFGSNIEDAVGLVSKLKEEFKDTRNLNFQDAIAKIGSTLKDLNLDGAATVPGITDFLKRVGALSDAIKPSITDLAAFGAVFEEANLTSEIAGSGFSKVLSVAANNAGLFSKQMKMSKQEVENLINTNSNEFILKFAESLKGLSGTDTAKTLKAVKLESDEVSKVMAILTDNIDKVRQKQELANKSFQDGTTITNTFNKYLNDEAGQISQIEKAWSRVTNSFMNWLTKASGPMIMAMAGMAEKSETAAEAFDKQDKKTTNLNKILPSLIGKYETLSLKQNKSAQEQEQLNITMQNIANIVPGAVSHYDDLGRVMSINIGLINDYREAQNLLQKQTKNKAIDARNDENNNLGGQRKELIEELRKGETVYLKDRRNGVYESKKLTDEEILYRQRRLVDINKTIAANKKRVAEYNNEDQFKPVDPPKPSANTKSNVGDSDKDKSKTGANKAENARIRREKYEQTERDNMIELQAKLAFEEKMALADDEQKKILTAEKKAKDELKQVRNQFKDIDGLVIKHADLSEKQQTVIDREVILIKKRLAEEKINIEREYLKKQDDVYEAHANKVIQIAQDEKKLALDKNLQNAKNAGGSLGIFNAEERIINNDESVEKFNQTVKYLKEQQDAKGNKAALELIEKNHVAALELILNKYQQKRNQHLFDASEKETSNSERNKLNSLSLDVEKAEARGQDPFQQKLALLKAQEDAEIASAEKTGASVADIRDKFALKRAALEQEHLIKTTEKYIGYFNQAMTAVSSIFSASLQNRTIEEQNGYDNSIKKLDDQKDHGILTNRQYMKQKQATDKEHDKAQRKLKREQWELDKASTLTNIVMQTALGVMKATPNIPLQIATGILGGIEFGIAAGQKPPAYAKGGYIGDNKDTRRRSNSAIQIIANEEGQEYITPNWQLNDPAAADLIDILDYRRVNKITGYAKGGFIGDDAPVIKPGNKSFSTDKSEADYLLMQFLKQNIEVLTQVAENVQNIQANIHWTEPDTFELAQKQTKLTRKLDSSYGNTNQSLIQ